MGDARNCYSYLQENVPIWTIQLKELAEKIEKGSTRNEDVSDSAVNQPENDDKRDSSMETLGPAGDNAEDTVIPLSGSTPVSTTPCQVNVQPPAETTALQSSPILCKRKRASSTSTSGRAAVIGRYRSKSSIVVLYDSEAQNSFASIVRSIGAGRNMIRKAIVAARMAKAAAIAAEVDDNDDDEDGFKDASLVLAKLGHRAKFGRTEVRSIRMTSTNRNTLSVVSYEGNSPGALEGSESFFLLDKTLEKAQNQCERGAHQLLRDGDCSEETESILAWFQEIVAICEKELTKASKEDESADASLRKDCASDQSGGTENVTTIPLCTDVDLKIKQKAFDTGANHTVDVKIEQKPFESPYETVDIKLDGDYNSSKGGAHIKSSTFVDAM